MLSLNLFLAGWLGVSLFLYENLYYIPFVFFSLFSFWRRLGFLPLYWKETLIHFLLHPLLISIQKKRRNISKAIQIFFMKSIERTIHILSEGIHSGNFSIHFGLIHIIVYAMHSQNETNGAKRMNECNILSFWMMG